MPAAPPAAPSPGAPSPGATLPSASLAPHHLAANVMHFARMLRRAGLPVGPADVIAAQQALTGIDVMDRTQAATAMRASMIHRREHRELFDHAFALFWRDPAAIAAAAAAGLMAAEKAPPARPAPGARRLGEAMAPPAPRPETPTDAPPELDATLTVSASERLQQMDFEAMGAAEIAAARRAIARLRLPLDQRPTRRLRPDATGPRIDLRATLRQSLRRGGEIIALSRARRRTRTPPLVVLCDISGSMARYAQILLHFLHAVTNDRDRVHVFLFGTRLSNITRQLRHRDPEMAFQLVSQLVPDFSGGTRIGAAIAGFNRIWARRVLGQGAVVLLITDGLERDIAPGETAEQQPLAAAMERLHRSCRRLIWLNPLLRFAGFEPRSIGIRAMLPHVDEFRPVHNLASLAALVETLSRPAEARRPEQEYRP
ncbi:MAG: VWA domain-containing protein [Rhodospirillales bacterium]|nr:VWA domain-containing protein [Rhodospirillales bacterium]